MNIEDLQLVTRNVTSNAIINFFSKNKKMSNEIILRFFKSNLVRNGNEIHDDQFYHCFKELEEIGVGAHNDFNGQRGGRFVSSYILNDVAEQILNPNKQMEIRKIDQAMPNQQHLPYQTAVTRPRIVSAPKPTVVAYIESKKSIVEPTKAPNAASKVSDNPVLFMFITEKNEYIPFPLHEVPRLVAQAELIKARMS